MYKTNTENGAKRVRAITKWEAIFLIFGTPIIFSLTIIVIEVIYLSAGLSSYMFSIILFYISCKRKKILTSLYILNISFSRFSSV